MRVGTRVRMRVRVRVRVESLNLEFNVLNIVRVNLMFSTEVN